MRGSHAGSYEAAHALRDGDFWSGAGAPQETGETYDLVVVGGGISGLSAAHFWLKAHPAARILVLENHDDFGGHAKRNEFRLGGGLQLMNGGTLEHREPLSLQPRRRRPDAGARLPPYGAGRRLRPAAGLCRVGPDSGGVSSTGPPSAPTSW